MGNSSIITATIPHFNLVLPFVLSEYEGLSKIGAYQIIEKNVYLWSFKVEDIHKVQNILGGKIIQFDKDDLMRNVLSHCEPLMVEIQTSVHKKGKGTISVMVEGEGYIVTWHQNGVPVQFLVAQSLVELIWSEVISKMKLDEPVKTRDVCEKIVKALGLSHWNFPFFMEDKEDKYMRECIKVGKWNHARSGNFDFQKFFGARKDYFKLFYTPIKCLKGLGWVEHTKGGMVIRLKESDDFVKDVRLDEITMIENEYEEELYRPDQPDNILAWAENMK